MPQAKSEFLRAVVDRGYLHQCTDLEELDALAEKGRVTGYIGFDATADSLHVGSLVPIMLLGRLQQAGHKPIVLMGGGTTRVGDPSGKDASRQLLTDQVIESNKASIRGIFAKFLSFGDGPTDAVMLDNDAWLGALNYLEFLRDYGRHFSVNRMLSFDSVKLRLEREQTLSFLEFNYMVLQAYDFVELAKRHECVLQMGGSDQWGNIVNGVELGRRTDDLSLYGLTSPLITTASGAKMGKTAAGAVWLNEDRLSAYDYWQFWRNTEDADVDRFLKLFTDLPLDEIERLAALEGAEVNAAKKILATEATAMCHGRAVADQAAATAEQTFEHGGTGQSLPEITLTGAELDEGVAAFRLLVMANLCSSNGEARRLIRGGGARVNDQVLESEDRVIGAADVSTDGVIKLSAGKKRHALVRPA
jgi:tyrosyl-tRNA synthetase